MAKVKKEAAPPVSAEDEGVAAEQVKKKPPLKLIIVAGVAALVIMGGGGAAMLLLGGHGDGHAHKTAHKAKKPTGDKKDDKTVAQVTDGPDGVVFYALPDLVVNIQSGEGRPTFLKLKLAFELLDHETADALEPNTPRLTDMFTTFLRELRPEDLAGSQGTWQLRMEIQRRVNLIIAPAKIKAVLIQEMLVQ